MITREGMETALLMGTLLFQTDGSNIIAGAAARDSCARRSSRGCGPGTATA